MGHTVVPGKKQARCSFVGARAVRLRFATRMARSGVVAAMEFFRQLSGQHADASLNALSLESRAGLATARCNIVLSEEL